jgi:leucyl-tRNA synthetase
MQVGVEAARDVCETAALENDQVQRFIGDNPVKKIIVVPGKLVNIVI